MPMLSMVTKVEKSGEMWIFLSADPVGWKVCRASPFSTSHHWQTNKRERLALSGFKTEMNKNLSILKHHFARFKHTPNPPPTRFPEWFCLISAESWHFLNESHLTGAHHERHMESITQAQLWQQPFKPRSSVHIRLNRKCNELKLIHL